MRPRVSVVIPAYNEGAEIDDCLDRILEVGEAALRGARGVRHA